MTELTAEMVEHIAAGLAENRTLNVLNLSQNNLGSKGAIRIIKSLCHPQLRELHLSNVHLKDDCTAQFRRFLRDNDAVRVLDISRNHLSAKFCSEIALPLSSDSKLQVLNLSRNPIGHGITSLGPALRNNTYMQSLDISRCEIDASSFSEFCIGFKLNTSLEKLVVSYNPLLDEGVSYLGDVLKIHPKLRVIDLEATEISDPAALAIFSAAIDAGRVEKINVKNNLIHDGVIVNKAVASIPVLRYCNVELNDLDYRVTRVIQKGLANNCRRWKEGSQSRVADKVEVLALNDTRLEDCRGRIKEMRDLITSMKDRLEVTQVELVRTRELRDAKLAGLESSLDKLIHEGSQEADEYQEKIDVLRADLA
jgi:Ran GTPase-activating protein (RanGAP) involved in mRNA processing and transport